ncbi:MULTISPECIES: ABC transporter substrate-binding protein [unclassified Mesorhizobium]|uniref:ABC transporter substrate-binding protein n=1 Tax=unclassified Mesorhizobium TaxID=325217 RepID=UPI000FD5E0B1|nr:MULTISPECIES: ABC transporter substrate-binding protein [unclassified Mesorhizobium]RVB80469.1 ABC transporter substrate-binding protein [Mesorhizobium sp. M6A.T.Cr.TU.014.01.1.1]RWQ10571.1 MAG: ABC transporter substrate-binding protein [Mesorhizobium sp.]RWQ10946.1 MAG: ABC transporter substrate-binding protein [Mesorhizobium sp.]
MKHFCTRVLISGAIRVVTLASPVAFAETPDDQLVIATSLAQVLSLDPHQATEAKANEIMANLYDRLVSTDASGKISPQLAQSWDIDDRGITFHLRETEFASGNPVTSADVVYSLTRLLKLDQAAAANLKRVGYNADNVETLVTAPDEKTVRIELSGEVTSELLLYRLAMVIASVVDSEQVKSNESNGDWGNAWLRTNSAGSGPFTLSRWTPNEIVILEANEGYVGGEPEMRRVVVRHVPESQVERLMLERGDVDIASALTASDLATFTDKEGFEIQRIPTGGFYVLSMNAGKEPLSNPKVREAIAYGIDYKGMEKAIMGPYGRARTVPVPENFEYAIPSPDWHLDVTKAKSLLAEAGYENGFTLTLKTISQTPRIDLATAIQASLGEIGITLNIQQGNGSEIIAAHRARNFDLLIPQTGAYMQNVLGSMEQFSSNPDNSREANNAGNFVWRSAWDIPELTALTAKASLEPDAKKRGEIYVQMQDMFVAQKPAVLPLFERFEPIVVSTRVQNYVGHPSQTTRLEGVKKTEAE